MPDAPHDRAARRRACLTLAVTGVVAAGLAVLPTAGSAQAAPSAPSRFVPVTPCRLLDTRQSGGAIAADDSIDLAVVSDACGVPGGASAAAITITVDRPTGSGFITAWPTGTNQPEASVLNYRAGEIIANSQLLQIGSGGRVSLYTMAQTHVVVDVTGYFVPAGGAARSGRFVPVATERLIDTRQSARPAPGTSVRIDPDVPAGTTAVAVNITTSDSVGAGFFTAFAAGTRRPTASVLNTDGPGQIRAAATIVPVNDDGFDVYTMAGDHVIVDITGYFTGSAAASSTAGMFVSNTPARLVDTRRPNGASGGPRLWDKGGREFSVTGITGGPVAAVSANVTMTATEDSGFVTAVPARASRPLTSSVNADSAQRTIANGAIIEVSTAGIQFTTHEATHLVVDISGWFTGSPVPASGAAPVNSPPPDRKVTIISDSAFAGIRWFGGLDELQGFVVDHRMESCRRLVAPSCRGREGYAPRNVVGELAALPPVGPEDIVVIATGYDDWWQGFSSDFDIVTERARARGFRHIVWVTFKTEVPYRGYGEYYARMNEVIWQKVASGAYPDVRVWDFDRYTAGVPEWFTSDGIHFSSLGAAGSADWISRHVRAFDDRPCPQPMRPGENPPDPCPNPDTLPETVGYPDIRALYPSTRY